MMIIALDPLLSSDIGLSVILVMLMKVVIAFALLMVSVMLVIWFERKIVADMHNRVGPSLAGPWGILQTLADGIKLFFKEDLLPERADRIVFRLAPYLSLVPAFLSFAIVPIGGDFTNGGDGTVSIFGHRTLLQVADPPVGILLFLALSSIAVYGVMLAGWSSGSKYPLLGSVRASAQMISYEAALGLSMATVFLSSGTLSTSGIVAGQATWNWNLVTTGIIPFVIFVIAGTAELNRPPFDLVEAEQELVGGFHTEYSSIRFALFFLAEFMNMITMSAIAVTLFLGGPNGPILIKQISWVWPILWFFLKVMAFLFTFVWLRATLPRLRYDQLMDLGWKLLIPASLGWFLLIAALNIGEDRGWSSLLVVPIGLLILSAAALLLKGAIKKAKDSNLDAADLSEISEGSDQ
ncbi:MAG: NADH-quinone oxidoreductase subunit NuoH [Actinomycetota bacterium]|nr:NADH-quinone oxidoreductase subunit NuoH [Acidimicrobiales bacterium]MEC7898866.1 NADH-quinone oxidoreductase subunit NuoH [Actinomycetota bacterium]|tara:strand:+ start:1939 stop:3162 length:1224 start_codon:yes stop_codon:yes gene_type:complete